MIVLQPSVNIHTPDQGTLVTKAQLMYLVVKHLRSLLHCGVVHCAAYIHLRILTQAMMRYVSSLMTVMMMIMSQDSDSSDEEMSAFLDHHRRAMSVQRERESQMR